MASDFSQNKLISINIKLTVSGYLRESQKLLPSSLIIPDLIEHLCLAYYYNDHNWDTKYIFETMKLKNNIISLTTQGSCTAFLNNIIYSGKHYWRFKIISCRDGYEGSITIGIWNIKDKLDNSGQRPIDTNFTYGMSSSYGLRANIGKKIHIGYSQKYAIPCKRNDIIDMYVDFDKLELKFSINEIDYGIAYNITQGNYIAAVALYHEVDSVKLIF